MNEKYKDIDGVLIYPRVSSPKQIREGHGLESQETLCRRFVAELGLADKIEAVFPEGMTGRLFDRPRMQELLRYIDEHKGRKYLVVFDDLKRLARDVQTHWRLKQEFGRRRAELASPNFRFEDSPTGRFIESTMAAAAQLEREQNAVQTKDKMMARMLNGCWTLALPSEYKYLKDPQFGKIPVVVEKLAIPLRRLFNAIDQRKVIGFENAREFLQLQYDELGIRKRAAMETTRRKLTNRLYTGVVEYPKWGIERRSGVHEAIVAPSVFDRVQDILAGRSPKRTRKDYRCEFRLRGRVACFVCNRTLTGSWNRGRNRPYANYRCYNRNCPFHTVSLPKEIIEPRFEDYLDRIRPTRQILAFVKVLLLQIWEDERRGTGQIMSQIKNEIETAKQQAKAHLESASKTSSLALKGEYEELAESAVQERKRLECELLKLRDMHANDGVGTAIDNVLAYFSEPVKLWRSDDPDDHQTVVDMYFETPPTYDPEYGFGTTKLTCLSEILQVKDFDKSKMVDQLEKSWNQIVDYITYWNARLHNIME